MVLKFIQRSQKIISITRLSRAARTRLLLGRSRSRAQLQYKKLISPERAICSALLFFSNGADTLFPNLHNIFHNPRNI